MKTIDLKLNTKYYSVYKESESFVLSENLQNLGVIYEVIEKFDSEANLKDYMLNMEKESGYAFERI
jgi:glutaredoxin-related protein